MPLQARALLPPAALIVGTGYLTTTLPSSFAVERPLHTAGVVLLVTGSILVGLGIPCVHDKHQDRPPFQHNGSRLPKLQRPYVLAILLTLPISARIGLSWWVLKHVECTGPSALPILPLLVAGYYSLDDTQDLDLDSKSRARLEEDYPATTSAPRRYILPYLLLAASGFWLTSIAALLRSTTICPVTRIWAVPRLSTLGFALDCVIVALLYALLNGRKSSKRHAFQTPPNITLLGVLLIACSGLLGVAGGVTYAIAPDHRYWILDLSSSYVQSLFALSLTIPCTLLSFLGVTSSIGFWSTLFVAALSASLTYFVQILRMVANGPWPLGYMFSLALPFALLGLAVIQHAVVSWGGEASSRRRPISRFARVCIPASFLLLLVSFGRYQRLLTRHPISVLIEMGKKQHTTWATQAHSSVTLHDAVRNYQIRYLRDPPPGFDKWYGYASSRNSVVIDDFDNIEKDLAPFWSLSPEVLRKRTAEVLVGDNGLGGISIRSGNAEVFANVPGTHRWMVDGTVDMIRPFAEHLPDMDIAMNLNDECRVAIPYTRWKEAHQVQFASRNPRSSEQTLGFSADRGSAWLNTSELTDVPAYFKVEGFNPTFQLYGSLSCPPDSPARSQYHWNTGVVCTSCSAPHSLGLFVRNWTESANPCHQPDLAYMHGLHMSPSALVGTHELIPIFSQSKAPGYADIRYPSPWNYKDKARYETDADFPDPTFVEKENTLFWRGGTTEGVSAGSGAWRGMLRQRLVHLANNPTSEQMMLLPSARDDGSFEYSLETPGLIQHSLGAKPDIHFVDKVVRCGGKDCSDQESEFTFVEGIDFKQHWRYKFLFDADGAGFSGRFIPFMQSRSLVFKSALFREWYEGRLTAWHHFVPVDLRLHDLWSILAYFGGWQDDSGRKWEGREKEANRIARQGRMWTEKVLRKEDMEIYMFRLLLELGRLTDDNRDKLGYRPS
ncbi:glycosyltransferase family 90 protein [Lophiostoma macrostomum CBS 122681]|uniref:Glycosyltransferase family 90 protein n=1 Tax=Lophiostoma macrostomum CBS 122681 TaxID=1314788 RepID=A0A6A6TQ49_9PLEO|nr:glycosyltransferase family 90 protein [Lophiostoma macrostomum CBS 122681]